MSDWLKIPNQPLTLPKREPQELQRQAEGALGELEREKLRLKKATKEFESFFTAAMLKSMRATVPKVEDNAMSLGGGLGKDIFQSMFDEELAKEMAAKSEQGLGPLLYRSLLPRLESQFETVTDATVSTEASDMERSEESATGPVTEKTETER